MMMRIGQGFDVHRFKSGRPMILGGFRLPFDVGLDGHSDADVVLHAVTDAILGAIGEGDIGHHFPPTDSRWAGANSREFVRHALLLAANRGFSLVNCDVTVIGERPKIGPHREPIREALAECLETSADRVNVKATTTEGLGWTGRAEGLACTAVVLMSDGRL